MTTGTVLLPCPFCGSLPSWLSRSMAFGTGASGMEAPMRALGCINPLCAMSVQTPWRDTQEYRSRTYVNVDYDAHAIAAWNCRAVGKGKVL